MSKSKNWKAAVGDTLISSDLTLNVSGEINTGGIHQIPQLTKKSPQGITVSQLILEASPISDVVPENFASVSFKEQKLSGRHKYTSILIVDAKNGDKLEEITDIDQHIA